MEVAVKYVHIDDPTSRSHNGSKPGLCFRGTKYAHCVLNYDSGIGVTRVDLREYDRMRDVPDAGSIYSPRKMAELLISYTKRTVARRTITQGALELINRLLEGKVTEVELTPEATTTPVEEKVESHRPGVLADLCKELKIEPAVARRKLRAAGLHAPYNDASAIRAVLK